METFALPFQFLFVGRTNRKEGFRVSFFQKSEESQLKEMLDFDNAGLVYRPYRARIHKGRKKATIYGCWRLDRFTDSLNIVAFVRRCVIFIVSKKKTNLALIPEFAAGNNFSYRR